MFIMIDHVCVDCLQLTMQMGVHNQTAVARKRCARARVRVRPKLILCACADSFVCEFPLS